MVPLEGLQPGISHSEANEAKVVTFTTRRPRVCRIWRTVPSSRSSSGATVLCSNWPSGVSATCRVPRWKRVVPSSSSSARICRLTADWVRNSSSAAPLKLKRRATASNARKGPMLKGRWRGVFMRKCYQSGTQVSLDPGPGQP